MFADRREAGRALADALADAEHDPDLVVGIARGGVPVAVATAAALGVPADAVVVKKVGSPHNPEFALGAVTPDGVTWWNDRTVTDVGFADDERERAREEALAVARERAAAIGVRPDAENVAIDDENQTGHPRQEDRPPIAGRTIAVVDDGVATGATMHAAVASVREHDPEAIVAGVPVGPPDRLEAIADEVDELVALETPAAFRAVGAYYDAFDQVATEQVASLLERRVDG